MKKGLLGIALAVLAVTMAAPASAQAMDVEVTLAPLGRSFAPPSIGRNQGWLAVSNRDWQPYTIVIERKGRATLYRGDTRYPGMQSVVVPSGSTITLSLEKDTWEFRGDGDEKLKVKVREGRTSTLSLEPFGRRGNSGLRGISNDGDRVRNEILFNNYYAPPVVVERPPVIVQAPPPPPVIVNRPPVIVETHRPRPPYHRPPPPPRRPNHNRNDGWGFSFGFNSGR